MDSIGDPADSEGIEAARATHFSGCTDGGSSASTAPERDRNEIKIGCVTVWAQIGTRLWAQLRLRFGVALGGNFHPGEGPTLQAGSNWAHVSLTRATRTKEHCSILLLSMSLVQYVAAVEDRKAIWDALPRFSHDLVHSAPKCFLSQLIMSL